MPFEVKDNAPPRFDGDFQVLSDPAVTPGSPEALYLEALDAALSRLESDHKADLAAAYPAGLLESRMDSRKETAASLREIAQAFVNGNRNAASAGEETRKAQDKYLAKLARFGMKDASPARFEGDFELVVVRDYVPTQPEIAYKMRLETVRKALANDEMRDAREKYSPELLKARKELRKEAAARLRAEAVQFCKGRLSAQTAEENALIYLGQYIEARDRLLGKLFQISVIPAGCDLAEELEIKVASGLPAPNDTPSQEKQELFVQLANATTVIRTVCQQIGDRVTRRSAGDIKAAKRRARLLQDEYIRKLAGIGRIGLEGPHTGLAKLALTSLKSEFVAREGGRIKNRYVRRLGLWSAAFGALFLIAYAGIVWTSTCAVVPSGNATASCPAASWTWSGPALHAAAGSCAASTWVWSGPATHAPPGICAVSWPWWDAHKMFLLAAAGAAIGTWISFAIRRLDLPFEDLALLEEQSLEPPFRILFVTALTLIVCLLFWNGAVNIEIGNLKTGPEFFKHNGTIALLIGVFGGLSERALATAVSGRAAAFVKGVAGAG
jgi:hypothetical protein